MPPRLLALGRGLSAPFFFLPDRPSSSTPSTTAKSATSINNLVPQWNALLGGKTTESLGLTLAHYLLIQSIDAPYRSMSLAEMDTQAQGILETTTDTKEGEIPLEALEVFETLQGRRLAVLTGFGNPDTSYSFGNVLAKAWGTNGQAQTIEPRVAVIGIGNGDVTFKRKGLYFTSGVSHAAWSPNWREEMPPLTLRLRHFIKLDPNKPLDLGGYSKGGYHVWAFGRLREIFRQTGTLTKEDVSHFPGLETPAMLDHLRYFIDHYTEHEGLAMGLAVPVGGVHPKIYKTPFGRGTDVVTHHAINSLSQQSIETTYAALGKRRFEEVMDGGVFGDLSHPARHALLQNPGTGNLSWLGRAMLMPPRWAELFMSSQLKKSGDGIGDFGNVEDAFLNSSRVRVLPGFDHITLFFAPQGAAVFAKRSARILHERRHSQHHGPTHPRVIHPTIENEVMTENIGEAGIVPEILTEAI